MQNDGVLGPEKVSESNSLRAPCDVDMRNRLDQISNHFSAINDTFASEAVKVHEFMKDIIMEFQANAAGERTDAQKEPENAMQENS